MKKIILFALLLAIINPKHVYSQTLESYADSLISLMTDEEKVLQLHQYGVFNTSDNERLDIPGIFMANGPHGVRKGRATSFPTTMAMAASWDTNLIWEIGKAMAMESWGLGVHQILGPCMDMCWDSRNGRSPETGGEDPFLSGEITTSLILGMQTKPIIATAKHFVGVAMQTNRFHNEVTVSDRMIMEHYGHPFRMALQKGNSLSIMNAFNLINGTNCSENKYLLDTVLRQRWGYPFYLVSDWTAVWDAPEALIAGTDLCMGDFQYRDGLPHAISSGIISQDVLNRAVKRVLLTKMLGGVMGYYPQGDRDEVNKPEHQALCRKAGQRSIVLLKNEKGILPFNKVTPPTLAVIGPAANQALLDGKGSSTVIPFYTISPKEGLEIKIGAENISYTKGCDINSTDTSGFENARALAKKANYTLFVGGLGETQEGEGLDRKNGSFELPGKQQDLINELAKTNPNLIVVIKSGGVCALSQCLPNIKGLLYAFYPGQEGGNAIADVLFGDYNPSGKMPVTMPKNNDQWPTRNLNYNDDYGSGYRWFDKSGESPEFAFGFGLSYTTFNYYNATVQKDSFKLGEPIHVSIDIENTGERKGEEVTQLYLAKKDIPDHYPIKQLKGFHKTELQASEKKTLEFTLTANELFMFDDLSKTYKVDTGEYMLYIGNSSDSLKDSLSVTIVPDNEKPDFRISQVSTFPRNPVKGQEVYIAASVLNYGTGASPNDQHTIKFYLDDKEISSSNYYTNPIKTGSMALISTEQPYIFNDTGVYSIKAVIDPDNMIDECIENNNMALTSVEIHDSAVLYDFDTISNNIALNKPATASEYQDSTASPDKAVDGKYPTRWGAITAGSDIESLSIDLLNEYYIDSVILTWGVIGYPEKLQFSIKDTSNNWVIANTYNENYGGRNVYKNIADEPASGIQVTTLLRHQGWKPYSLYEFEVYGKPHIQDTSVVNNAVNKINSTSLFNEIYPNPFEDKVYIDFVLAKKQEIKLEVFDITGKLVRTIDRGYYNSGKYIAKWNGKDHLGKDMPPGNYIIALQTPYYILSKICTMK